MRDIGVLLLVFPYLMIIALAMWVAKRKGTVIE